MPPNLKRTLFFSLKLTVSAALFYVVLRKAGAERVFALLADIRPMYFASAVGLYLMAQLAASARWGLLLEGAHPLRKLFPLYLLGSFFNTFLPGLVGGDAVKAYYLYRETGRGTGTRVLSSVFMDRYIGYCSLMALGLASYPFAFGYLKDTWLLWLLPIIVAGFVAASLLVLGLRPGRRFRVLGDVYEYFHSYRDRAGVIARAGALSLSIQLTMVLITYVLSLGLGMDVPFLAFLVFFPIIVTVSTVPVSLSGVGVREAAFVILLGRLGVKPENAVAVSFAYFLSVSAGGLAGLYEYLRHKDYGKVQEERT